MSNKKSITDEKLVLPKSEQLKISKKWINDHLGPSRSISGLHCAASVRIRIKITTGIWPEIEIVKKAMEACGYQLERRRFYRGLKKGEVMCYRVRFNRGMSKGLV